MRVHGSVGTIYRLIRYPFVRLQSAHLRTRIFTTADAAGVFTRIYETNWWSCEESVSGTGSTLAYTANLRKKLPELFEKYAIRKVYDAPCGDFNWMRHVIQSYEIDYIGGDIVPQLIESNRANYEDDRIRFTLANVIEDEFPQADIWICRDCLIHFSFSDILSTFENFASSEVNFLLTTTHINQSGFRNMDIQTGDARVIDLFSHPFFLPMDCLDAIDDWLEPDLPRRMVLFSRQQIIEALPKMRSAFCCDAIGV